MRWLSALALLVGCVAAEAQHAGAGRAAGGGGGHAGFGGAPRGSFGGAFGVGVRGSAGFPGYRSPIPGAAYRSAPRGYDGSLLRRPDYHHIVRNPRVYGRPYGYRPYPLPGRFGYPWASGYGYPAYPFWGVTGLFADDGWSSGGFDPGYPNQGYAASTDQAYDAYSPQGTDSYGVQDSGNQPLVYAPYPPGYGEPEIPSRYTVITLPQPQREEDAVTLFYRDGRPPEQIRNYALTRTSLLITGDRMREIPLSDLDLALTVRVNQAAGVDFRLPAAP